MDLDPFGKAVKVGSVRLRTPGLRGTVKRRAATPDGLRGPTLSSRFSDILARNQIRVQESIELEARETGARDDYHTRHGEPALVLEADEPAPGFGQFVLTTDESGVITFDFVPLAQPTPEAEATRGAGATRKYLIRRTIPHIPDSGHSDGGETDRGLAGYVMKRVMEVLVFPLIDPALRAAGTFLAANWEKDFRPYRLRGVSVDDYRTNDVEQLTPADWKRLQGGRALLPLVHGFFSRAREAFSALTSEDVAATWCLYGGRVFAQPTTSRCRKIRGRTRAGSSAKCLTARSSTSTFSATRAGGWLRGRWLRGSRSSRSAAGRCGSIASCTSARRTPGRR